MIKAKKISKMMLIILLVSFLMVLVTACRTHHYSRSEMNTYLKDLFDDKEFVVSKKYIEREGSDHNIDRVWEVYLKDNPDLIFKACSNKYYSTEWADYNQNTDFSYVYGLYYYKLFSEKKQTHIKWKESKLNETNDYLMNGRIYIAFTNRQELQQAVKEIKEFYEFLNSQGYPIKLGFIVEYSYPELDIRDYSMEDNEYYATEISVSTIDEVTKMYAQFLLDYRLDNMNEFTKDELIYYNSLSDKQQFTLIAADGKTIKYNDILLSKFGYGMSFGSIYEVLIRNGFKVNGNTKHFDFIGIDGNKYEFSYKFHDYPYNESDGTVHEGYYYMKNGKKIPMNAYFYNHVSSSFLKEISGMSFD